MSDPAPHLRFLHLHSSFDAGGKELRCVRLIQAFGAQIAHAIVSGAPGALSASARISPEIQVDYPQDLPPLVGFPSPGRFKRIAEAMRGYDLVLSYNWGAMDAVMAHRLHADALSLPPLIHHEDGFNEDEARRLKLRRNWYRRIALARAAALVVPSRKLEEVALEAWGQPRARVHRIANGIDLGAGAAPPVPDAVPGLVKQEGERWVGTLAGLRAVKNLPRMVRAFAGLPPEWRLVILGEGPERATIEHAARVAGVADRVNLPGFVDRPGEVAGLFDIFALSSDSEQSPISVVEAMAAGVPVAAPALGDIAEMVAPENAPFIVEPENEAALAQALQRLAAADDTRAAIGRANRAKARAEFDEARMIARYSSLYGAAIGRDTLS